jgi:hypothetical protein
LESATLPARGRPLLQIVNHKNPQSGKIIEKNGDAIYLTKTLESKQIATIVVHPVFSSNKTDHYDMTEIHVLLSIQSHQKWLNY